MAFIHQVEQKLAQWVHHLGSIQWPIPPWADVLHLYILLELICLKKIVSTLIYNI